MHAVCYEIRAWRWEHASKHDPIQHAPDEHFHHSRIPQSNLPARARIGSSHPPRVQHTGGAHLESSVPELQPTVQGA